MKTFFRKRHPQRTCTKKYSVYRQYKQDLASDFFHRCGYTDCADFWFGGQNSFHIDHFVPWKKHPNKPSLKTDYQNLVYCCSYVNILKSNDETNYLDPCQIDFNKHFSRDIIGNIVPNVESKPANYMYNKLKLYLKRYQIIWILENICERIDKLDEAISNLNNKEHENELRLAISDLARLFIRYKRYLSYQQ